MSKRPFHAVAVFLLVSLFVSSTRAEAPAFKVGDRVLVSPSGLMGAQYWEQCTVIRELKLNSYGVKCDPIAPGRTAMEYSVLPSWVKPLAPSVDHGAPPSPEKAAVSPDGTVLASRPFVDCNIQQPTKAKNGDSIPPELAKRLIQCLWEKPAVPGSDGGQTVDIDSLEIGRSRKWVYRQDMGQGIEDLDTRVWPLDVTWTWKTYYRTRTRVNVQEDIFNCYVNAFGKWSCGLGQRVKAISTKDIEVK